LAIVLRTPADSRLSSHFFRLRHRYPRRERSHIAYLSICMHRVWPCFWGFPDILRISTYRMPWMQGWSS